MVLESKDYASNNNKENKPTSTMGAKRSISGTSVVANSRDCIGQQPQQQASATDIPSNSRKSEQSSSTFRLGSFTKSLLAKAQSDESGLSPGTLQTLVNPMRSQLGLPCLSLFSEPPSKTSPPSVETHRSSAYSASSAAEGEQEHQSPPFFGQRLDTDIPPLDKDDSGVDSSKFDSSGITTKLEDAHYKLPNSSFSATDDLNAFKRLAMYDSSDAAAAAEEDCDQSTELPKFTQANLHKGPLLKSSSFFPTPSKTVVGHGITMVENNNNNNNNTFPEVAAVIPTPKPKSKYPSGGGGGGDNNNARKNSGVKSSRNLTTPNANKGAAALSGQLMKQKSLSSVKEKKPAANAGWKFSSEHVQGKEYLIIKQLGKGGCGEVLLVIEKESRELFALKRVNLSGIADASVEECVNEVQMLVDFRDSELVVHIYAWEFDKGEKTMKILMEHGQCDLQHSIKAKNLTSLKLRSIWERLLTIVDVIHKRGIVHADLKPANFIWSGDNLKIIDFGIASRLQSDHTSIAMLCPKGTLNFISPETIQPDSKISPKSDIWSLGCILYLMVYGTTPFEHIGHPIQKMTAIVKGSVDYPPIPQCLSSSATEILSVLKLCFQMDYRRRPSASDLLHHPLIIHT